MRGITAFLLRIKKEETNPTFEHPDNWNQLNLQEKANLIIIDNIIKLVDLQDRESITEYKEKEVHGIRGKGPSTEEKGYRHPDSHMGIGQSHHPFEPILVGPATNPACCPDGSRVQHLPVHPHATNYNQ